MKPDRLILALAFFFAAAAVLHPQAGTFRETRRSLVLLNVLGLGITYDFNLTKGIGLGGGLLFMPAGAVDGESYFYIRVPAHINLYLSPRAWLASSFLVSPTYELNIDSGRITHALSAELGYEYRKRFGFRASAGLGINLSALFSGQPITWVTLPWVTGLLGAGIAF